MNHSFPAIGWRRVLILVLLLQQSLICQGKKQSPKKKEQVDTMKYANLCATSGKTAGRVLKQKGDGRKHAVLKQLLQLSGAASVKMSESAQHKATCWILFDDPAHLTSGKRLEQRYALAVFYFATTNGGKALKWIKEDGWMTKQHECRWHGITCDMRNRVKEMRLSFNKVAGLMPRELSLLKDLVDMDLHGNDLQGVIPYNVLSGLKHLRSLKLHMNSFFGQIPSEMAELTSLRTYDVLYITRIGFPYHSYFLANPLEYTSQYIALFSFFRFAACLFLLTGELHLYGNYFQGKIPTELSKLTNLEFLDLYANAMTGTVPSQLSNLKNLRELHLNDNELVGRMPKSICEMKKLDTLVADCLGPNPEVICECCTTCCRGVPDPMCQDKPPKKTNAKTTNKKK
eukprot:scaffold84918_cov57-Attheya_sp.AAC.2